MATQDEINYGQQRINFELNEVDKKVVKTLQTIMEIFKKLKDCPPVAHDLQDVDFAAIDGILSKAYTASERVADIKPPGCAGPYPP
jgi:hypothetical protein